MINTTDSAESAPARGAKKVGNSAVEGVESAASEAVNPGAAGKSSAQSPGANSGTDGATADEIAAQAAAIATKVAATFGQAVGLLMRSGQHKHYSLTDLEWLLVPPLLLNQFTLLSGKPKDGPDVAVPLGLALWAKVSAEVDEKLSANLTHPIKLRPDEWASGDIHWLIDIIGAPDAGKVMVAQLRQNALQGKALKLRVKDKAGKVEVRTLDRLQPNTDEAAEPLA